MIGVIAEVAKVATTVEKVATTAEKVGKVGNKVIDVGKRIDVATKSFESVAQKVDISKRILPDGVKDEVSKVGKELTAVQKKELVKEGMAESILDRCTVVDGVYNLKTIYEKFEGLIEPQSGIRYVRKTIDFAGSKLEGVFPKFKSIFTVHLPKDMLFASDSVQFKECTKQLQQALNKNPLLKLKFNARQLEQIAKGITPDGFTWHHNEEVGKMELVDRKKHNAAKHIGGKAIWGGGR